MKTQKSKLRRKRLRSSALPASYKEQVFFDGKTHFTYLLQDIAHAQKSIDLETYAFHNDHLGQQVAQALVDAAKRGVRVRVMVDGAGSPLWSTNFANQLEIAGAITKVFHPFPWQLWNWSRSVVKLPLLLKWTYLILKINFRNHRKVCLIDKTIAYIGSLNICKHHLAKSEGGDGWRDTSVRLSGTDFDDLQQAFESAWDHRTIKERIRKIFQQVHQDIPVRLNYTRHRRRILYKNLLRKIAQCKQRIWITNAYFVPDNFLLKKLKEAARSGVDVRILLPRKSDVIVMPWASSTFYYSLLQAGVRIFEYLPSMLHAKSLILDHWMLIGSSNLNYRSLLHDLEVDINIATDSAKQTLVQQFLDDLQHARELSLHSWKKMRPLHQRMMGRLVLYMK